MSNGSKTLHAIVSHWIGPFPKDGEGWVDLPFSIENFCRENDARLAEAEALIDKSFPFIEALAKGRTFPPGDLVDAEILRREIAKWRAK